MRDPQLAVTYGGPETGKGAQIKWTSKVPSIGTGSMEISESEPNRHIDLAVNFNGLDGTSSYDVVPAGSGSKVTWTFGYNSGSSPLKRWKALMLDGFVGAEYRAGLDRLKEKIEVGTAPDGAELSARRQRPENRPQPEQPAAALPPGSRAARAAFPQAGARAGPRPRQHRNLMPRRPRPASHHAGAGPCAEAPKKKRRR